MFQRSPRASARRALAWPPLAASLVAFACSAPPGTDVDDEELPEYSGSLPAATGGPGPGTSVTPPPGAAPASPVASANPTPPPGPASNEQPASSGTPIAPSTPPSNGNAGNGTNVGANSGAGGSGMVPTNEGDLGAAGSSMDVPTDQQPPPVTTPPVTTPPPAAGPDIPCPADATFCSGFEGAGLPADSVFQPTYLAGEALGGQVELDTTVFHAGRQSLHMPVGANYYRMLAVPVPGNSFWVRLYTRSDVGLGAPGSTHASLFLASILAPDGDYNGDSAVEIAEQFGQVLLNVKDSLFGTGGTNPNGMAGTRLPNDTWTCMEAQFDGATGDVRVFVEGNQIIDATGWQPPSNFQSFRFGYLRYDSPARDVWMDDVVVAASRINCQ